MDRENITGLRQDGNGSLRTGEAFDSIAIELTGQMERFDSFWEGPEDVEKGYKSFGQFYRANYLKYMPGDRASKVLVISCGPGYFVHLLREEGYFDVLGIDSDPEKVRHAVAKGLDCRTEEAFPFLARSRTEYDVIFVEQELNHLTKDEMMLFVELCHQRLSEGGRLIVHGLNGANPITGAEALAQNFNHYNTFTDYSLKQVLEHAGFRQVRVIPLNLYVFYKNPFNYVGLVVTTVLHLLFSAAFMLYGKKNRMFTKKIAAIGKKRPGS